MITLWGLQHARWLPLILVVGSGYRITTNPNVLRSGLGTSPPTWSTAPRNRPIGLQTAQTSFFDSSVVNLNPGSA